MKVFAVLCLASLALASPQGYSSGFSSGYSGSSGYTAPTVVSERTYTIRPQLQGAEASYGGASYGGASFGGASQADFGGASFGGASYGANYASDYGRALGYSGAAAAPAYRSYQVQAAAPVYQAASGYEGAALGGAEQSYTVNFGVNSGRSLNLAGGYASNYNGYSGASAYSGEAQAAYGGASENLDLSAHAQGETKIYKHVYAFAGPEEPAQRAKVVVKAPVSNSKHYKLVFIKAPTSGAVVDSDITLPAQEEEKTQIYVLSKQQHHQPTIRIHTAQAAKHNKPEVLFVKYRNEAEAQAIASGAISGQASGIPAGGQIVSDGSVSAGGASGGYYGGNSGYSGYSGAGYGSGVSLGAATGRALIANSGFGSGSGSGFNAGYGAGSGSGSSSFSFGTGSGFGSGSGFGNNAARYSSRSYSGSF